MKYFFWCIIIIIPTITTAEPTVRTGIYLCGDLDDQVFRDTVTKNFELIITYDFRRGFIDYIRQDSADWRRNMPIITVYKGCLTLFNCSCPWYHLEQTKGGGHTVGGFYHFDSLFRGYYKDKDSINCFLMASDSTEHKDSLNRIKAGCGDTWEFRWVMDYSSEDYRTFFACSSKVQCLRNYNTEQYDSTYFDGVFIDHILHYTNEYGMYPEKYAIYNDVGALVDFDDTLFQNHIASFCENTYAEYHNPNTPNDHGREILAIGNCNHTYMVDTLLWKKYMAGLDGGMEENFAEPDQNHTIGKWQNMIWEMQYNESKGKIFLAVKKVVSDTFPENPPFNIESYDSTQMMYGLTCYLMGCDSMSYFWFCGDYQHYYWAPILDIDIGKPLGPYMMDNITNLAYRYYDDAIVFTNPNLSQSVTAGFDGDSLYILGPSDTIIDTVETFMLPCHNGAICPYTLNFFHGSSFELLDHWCLDNECIESQKVKCEASRCQANIHVTPHTGTWMYRITGKDFSGDTSYVRFKIFPYDMLIKSTSYLSFWIFVGSVPGEVAHIGLDCLLKSGERLSEWTRFGKILDQYGNEMTPMIREVPTGAWCQYVFSLAPAFHDTIDHIELFYYDEVPGGTGNICIYIDDIYFYDTYPILNQWHAERFPYGSPPLDPTYYDPNFNLDFQVTEDAVTVNLVIDPQGDSGEGQHWVEPTPGLRNNIIDVYVDSSTVIDWSQYDKTPSLVFSLLMIDENDEFCWLSYAKNASNHWWKVGWVDMGDTTRNYNIWEHFSRNLCNDYKNEYGVAPMYIKEMRLNHFARSEWIGDCGGTIKDLIISIGSEAPMSNKTKDSLLSNSNFESNVIIFGTNPTKVLRLRYHIEKPQMIKISLYDVSGRLIISECEVKEVGEHESTFMDLSSGIYFIEIYNGQSVTTRKIVLMK